MTIPITVTKQPKPTPSSDPGPVLLDVSSVVSKYIFFFEGRFLVVVLDAGSDRSSGFEALR